MYTFTQSLEIKDLLIRIILAIIVGGVIGFERGQKNRPAGFRTHMLVCLGATFIGVLEDITRLNLIHFYTTNPNIVGNSSFSIGRYGSQVISGIGFLGAGAILRDKGKVAGLTTAASLWIVGCLGLIIGWGYYGFSIISAIAVFMILGSLKIIDTKFIEAKNMRIVKILYTNSLDSEDILDSTYRIFEKFSIEVKKTNKKNDKNEIIYTLIPPHQEDGKLMIRELSKQKEIFSVEINHLY